MPKIKSKSAAKKRFRFTGTGKVISAQAGKRHGMIKRTNKQIRNQRGTTILTPQDAARPEEWVRDALFQPQTRQAMNALKWLGYADAHELAKEPKGTYTFWDYQAGAWQRNNGIRIDYALLSPQAADRFRGMETHRDARDMDKPSDHVPVVVDLDLEA